MGSKAVDVERVKVANAWMTDPMYDEMNFIHHISEGGYRSFSEAIDAHIEAKGRRPVTYQVTGGVGVSRYLIKAMSRVDQNTGVFRLVFSIEHIENGTVVDLGLDYTSSLGLDNMRGVLDEFLLTFGEEQDVRDTIFSHVKSFYAAMLEENYGAQTLLDVQCSGIDDGLEEFQSITAKDVHGDIEAEAEYNSGTISARHIQDILNGSEYYSSVPPTGMRIRIAEQDDGVVDGSYWLIKCVGYRWKIDLAVGRYEIRSFGVRSSEMAYSEVYKFICENMFQAAPQEVREALADERASYVKRLINGINQESIHV